MPVSGSDSSPPIIPGPVLNMAALLGACTFNGLTFGAPGSGITLSKIQGLHDLPGVKIADLDKTYDHGMWGGIDFLTMRVVTLTVMVTGQGNADFLNNLNTVFNTFQSSFIEQPFFFMNGTRFINCRVRKRSAALDIRSEANTVTCTVLVELNAMDPRIYDAGVTVYSARIPLNQGGQAFPVDFPVRFGAADPTYSFGVVNNGNFESRGTMTIYGPITAPCVENLTVGARLWFPTLVLGSSDFLTINLDAYGAWFDGTGPYTANPGTSVDYLLSTDSTWWAFQPGLNLLTFHGSTFGWTAAQLQIPFVSAWT
jgi:hypothetical protein